MYPHLFEDDVRTQLYFEDGINKLDCLADLTMRIILWFHL